MKKLVTMLLSTCLMLPAHAHERTVKMRMVSAGGIEEMIGTVTVSRTPWGALFTPDLKGLPSGLHGFHVHQNPNCAPGKDEGELAAAMAADGHLDPQGTGRHKGPYGMGHLGDLPALYVDDQGNATYPLLAPRLDIEDLNGRSLMIHVHGDNYSDKPVELGGGGARMACGIVE
jgi:Cu-Zn family superoxide dismutase